MYHLPLSLLLLPLLLLTPTHGSNSIDPLIRQVINNQFEYDPTHLDHDDLDLDSAHHHFTHFKTRFAKSYPTQQQHDYRFKVFRSNLLKAKLHQSLDPTALHGVTQFSDLTPSEFKARFLGVRAGLKYPAHANMAPPLPTHDLPPDFDWRDFGAVTEVKNQGGCGSCWSFSATGTLEGAHFVANRELVSLSEQQLLDCDHECDPEGEPDDCDGGCDGGLMNNAFEYLLKSGGLMREEDYPYTAHNGRSCGFDKRKIAAKVANFSVIPADDNQIAANLVKYGPLAVGINADYMSTYVGGVSCPLVCSKELDHGVLMVGYGIHDDASATENVLPYWIIKNSWGRFWGEDGYYRICRGRNACGVNTLVSSVAAVNVATE